MKSTAQNMHLCGMPSTQVQRAARPIAAGPLYATEENVCASADPKPLTNGL